MKKVLDSKILKFGEVKGLLIDGGFIESPKFDDEDYKIVTFEGKEVNITYVKLRTPPRNPYLIIEGDYEKVNQQCDIFMQKMPYLVDITNNF